MTWIAHQETREDGRYVGFYVSVHFDVTTGVADGDGSMEFSTTVSVVPNDFPYPECFGADCLGTLV